MEGELPEHIWQEIAAGWDAGHNILVKGGADNRKCETVLAAIRRYREAHPEYRDLYLLVRKCSKRTSEMELCFDRRRYTDNRIQLGYIAEGELLAAEHPEALVVLVLDEVDTISCNRRTRIFIFVHNANNIGSNKLDINPTSGLLYKDYLRQGHYPGCRG